MTFLGDDYFRNSFIFISWVQVWYVGALSFTVNAVSIMRTPCLAQAALMRQHEIILEIHFRSSVMSVNVIWRVWFDPILWESESVHWRFFTECCYIFANNGCEETIHNSILLLWHFVIDWKILQFLLFFFQFFKTFHGVL
jgi:hypothetical protein